MIVIGVASAIVLAQNDRTSSDALRIRVTAQQFAWRFEYPNGLATGMLRLPLGRDTILELRAVDVLHSFWVPEFGQKQDAVPGELTKLAVTPTKVGEVPDRLHGALRARPLAHALAGRGDGASRTSRPGSPSRRSRPPAGARTPAPPSSRIWAAAAATCSSRPGRAGDRPGRA